MRLCNIITQAAVFIHTASLFLLIHQHTLIYNTVYKTLRMSCKFMKRLKKGVINVSDGDLISVMLYTCQRLDDIKYSSVIK